MSKMVKEQLYCVGISSNSFRPGKISKVTGVTLLDEKFPTKQFPPRICYSIKFEDDNFKDLVAVCSTMVGENQAPSHIVGGLSYVMRCAFEYEQTKNVKETKDFINIER